MKLKPQGTMKVLSALLAFCLMSTMLAGFIPSTVAQGDALFKAMEPMVGVYNANVDRIPFIKTIASDARINAEINLTGGGVLVLGITTDAEAKVVSLERGPISDPTIRAYTDETTVTAIMTASNPVVAFQDALASGAIRFEGVGLGNWLKVGIVKTGIKLMGFFT